MLKFKFKLPATILATFLGLNGCQTMKDPGVIAVTGTTIGLEISQNTGTGSPQSTFGYKRAEAAIVSREKISEGDAGEKGAQDVANVVMELRYAREGESPGIYQRLAVGKKAVTSAGSAVMFAKKPDGSLDPGALKALEGAFSETLNDDSFDRGENAGDLPGSEETN